MRSPAVKAWSSAADFAIVTGVELGRVGDMRPGGQTDHCRVALRRNAKHGEAGAGAPAKLAVIGRPVSSFSCCQPSRKSTLTFRILAAKSAPSVVRSELVVCCATVRSSKSAPLSVKPFSVVVEACSRKNGVIEGGAEVRIANL